jgi:hypothetical protein
MAENGSQPKKLAIPKYLYHGIGGIDPDIDQDRLATGRGFCPPEAAGST